MIGKVPPEALAEVILERTGAVDSAVVQGPAYGEDTAAIDLGEQLLVVNADPLSLAAEQVGTLAVHVACNDVAASGARPRWLTNTMFLPDDDPETLEAITDQVDRTAESLEVAIVGGHAEYSPELSRPLLALGAMGVTDRYVPSGGATAGDAILVTAGAAIEGTAILASDFPEELREAGIDEQTLDRAAGFIEEISVLPAAMALRSVATGMHDPTEGGVLAGLIEMAVATGRTFEIQRESIPVRPETGSVCEAMGVDPLCIFGSGALLATIPAAEIHAAGAALDDADVEWAVVGEVADSPGGVRLDGESVAEAPTDELYPLWE